MKIVTVELLTSMFQHVKSPKAIVPQQKRMRQIGEREKLGQIQEGDGTERERPPMCVFSRIKGEWESPR